MADPLTGIAASIPEKVVTEVQKSTTVSTGGSDFGKILSEHLDQADKQGEFRKQILEAFGMSPGAEQVKAISAEGLEIQSSRITANQEIRTEGKVLDLLGEVNRGVHQMDNVVDLLGSGKMFTPPQLLSVQATLAINVINLELTKSIVEQVNTGVKTLRDTSFA